MWTLVTAACADPVRKRSIAESIASRLSLTITGVGMWKWNQLVVFGLPTTRMKNPARQVLAIRSGTSIAMP